MDTPLTVPPSKMSHQLLVIEYISTFNSDADEKGISKAVKNGMKTLGFKYNGVLYGLGTGLVGGYEGCKMK